MKPNISVTKTKGSSSCLCCDVSNYNKGFGSVGPVFEVLIATHNFNSRSACVGLCESCLAVLKLQIEAILERKD